MNNRCKKHYENKKARPTDTAKEGGLASHTQVHLASRSDSE